MYNLMYANAFTEVLTILKFISKEEYEKVPLDIIEIIEDNCNQSYSVEYNPDIPLANQNISKEARIIIALLFRDYWATQEQKNKIELKEKYDISILEAEKVKKYNTDDLFKKNKSDYSYKHKEDNNNQLVEYKETLFTKLKRIILKIIK